MSHYLKKGISKIYDRKSLPGFDITSVPHGKSQRKGTPRYICLKGAFTVEAALILPMLVCFFVTILFFFRVMQVELQVEKAMVDVGQTFAACAGEGNSGKMGSVAALKFSIMKELNGSKEVERYVTGGAAGIQLLQSQLEGDFVDIRTVIRMKVPVQLLGKQEVKIARRVRCRKWNGWNSKSSGEEEIWVYITETGTVYHRTKECTHLKLTVTSTSLSQVEEKRNENGEKYSECEKCAKKSKGQSVVYITNQGDRYHYDLQCSGIKRTIIMIKLSEVGSRCPCSRCGGKEP